MRLVACAAAAGAVALLAAAPGTRRQGRADARSALRLAGVTSPSGAVRYVAMADWKQSTMVATIRVEDGRVLAGAPSEGPWESPWSAWDGTKDGLSADGKRLVLASYSPRSYSLRTTVRRGRHDDDGVAATDRAPRPLGLRRPLAEREHDLRAPVRRPGSGHYEVRAIDAVTGKVVPGAIVDQREPDEEMLGSPMTRTWSAEPRVGVHALREAERHRLRPRARHPRTARPSASTCPGRASATRSRGPAAGEQGRARAAAAAAGRRPARLDRPREPRQPDVVNWRPPRVRKKTLTRFGAGATRPAPGSRSVASAISATTSTMSWLALKIRS